MKSTQIKIAFKSNCPFEKKWGIVLSMLFFLIVVSCKEATNKTLQEAYTNQLIHETSPYLLQHAHNPVNWKPWGDEALSLAKNENKLLIISIGYSSCHWCHVMEKESFQDTEVARVMNKDFINIKVDREERPDIDHVYMTAAQLMNGSAGWPLNVIALPDGRPIYISTYKEKKEWITILTKIQSSFQSEPDRLYEFAQKLEEGLDELSPLVETKETANVDIEKLHQAVASWKTNWDNQWGGDKENEKFMMPVRLQFLLKYAVLFSDKQMYNHVMKTLDKMSQAGVFDHLGGGFFRYATDSKWQVPHFEKMLYDNAQLIGLYANAFKTSRNTKYKDVVYNTFSFLEKNMANGQGGYYAAIDADSDGDEGKYYLWNEKELQQLLGEEISLFSAVYNPSKIKLGKKGFVLQPLDTDVNIAEKLNISLAKLTEMKSKWATLLLDKRNKRVKPQTDKKVLCSWNAQLGSGYIDAYMAFQDKKFLDKAEKIHSFLKKYLQKDAKLFHSYISQQTGENGFLEDYAFYIDFLINLGKATANEHYFSEAKYWLERTDALFYNSKKGFYQFASNNKLITTVIKLDDGIIASPNSVMAKNLMQLGHIYFNEVYNRKSLEMLSRVETDALEYLPYYSAWGAEMLNLTGGNYEVAIVGNEAKAKLIQINAEYLPNALVVGSTNESAIPIFENRYSNSKTNIYICQDNMCKMPLTNSKLAITQIKKAYGKKN